MLLILNILLKLPSVVRHASRHGKNRDWAWTDTLVTVGVVALAIGYYYYKWKKRNTSN